MRWSLQYYLWCKMHFLGEAIEELEYAGEKTAHREPQNLPDLLHDVFRCEEVGLMRQHQGHPSRYAQVDAEQLEVAWLHLAVW